MALATADLCDQFGAEVRVADPVFHDWGGIVTFAGPIETLRVFEDNALVRQVLETAGQGRVLVVDGGGSLRTALVGGNLAALAHHGMVVDQENPDRLIAHRHPAPRVRTGRETGSDLGESLGRARVAHA